jgi:hypothetical protein
MQELLNLKTDVTHVYIFGNNKGSIVVHEMKTNFWEDNVFQFVYYHNDWMRYLLIFLRKDSVNSTSYGPNYLDYSSILYIFQSKALVHLITSYLVPTPNFFSPLQQKYYLPVSRNTKVRLEVREIHYFIKPQKKVKQKRICLFKFTPDHRSRKVNCRQIQLKMVGFGFKFCCCILLCASFSSCSLIFAY